MKNLFLLSALMLDFAHVQAETCEKGFKAFQTTIYKTIREGVCIDCHDQGGKGPNYAVADAQESYKRVQPYIEFFDLERSTIVFRAGNGHCGNECNLDQRSEVLTQLRNWWDQGEKDCGHQGKFLSKKILVPTDLSTKDFATASLSFDSASSDLKDVKLSFEWKRLSSQAGANPGSIMIRKPRIESTSTNAVRAKTLRFLINDKYGSLSNAFERIDTVSGKNRSPGATSHGVLSPEATVIVEDKDTPNYLSAGFEELAPVVSLPKCKAFATFQESVLPLVEARNCQTCHRTAATKVAQRAQSRFLMPDNDEELCQDFLQRTSQNMQILPSIIVYPLRGVNGHPKIFQSSEEVVEPWMMWVKQERK